MATIDQAYQEMDQAFQLSSERREEMIALLQEAARYIKIQPGSDQPRTTEVKLATIKALTDLCKDQETLSMSKVKMVLAKIDTQNNGNINVAVTELLKRVNIGTRSLNPSPTQNIDDDSILQEKSKAAGVVVNPDETDMTVKPKETVKMDKKEFDIEEE